MDIILVSHKRGRTWRVSLAPGNVLGWLPLAFAGLLICSATFALGYGVKAFNDRLPVDIYGIWADDLQQQRTQLAKMREEVDLNTQALARRIAQLHAHVMRLDAAGARLTQMADLDRGEFDFGEPPPVGGPEGEAEGQPRAEPYSLDQITSSLDAFDRQLSDRARQMRVLEDLLLASRLQKEVRPSGWPVQTGWISSNFGMRMDPFSGLRSFHAGMDFAGREGSNVLAVAAGIITEAAPRFGYGLLVEVNHGNGYVTRYGHNKTALVQIGDRVHKGQPIALIGSSGRSTGPHVHFEVLLNGRVVNPQQYIQAAR